MGDRNQPVVVKWRGSTSRPVRATGPVSFDSVKIKNGSFQKSHIIPQEVGKQFQPFFERLEKATLPGGERGFNLHDALDNLQPLPSANSGAGGVTLFDLGQHKGSHPTVTAAISEQVAKYSRDLDDALAMAGTQADRDAAVAHANRRMVDLKDLVASLSVGGFKDPNNASLRLVYNIADPNASVIPDWAKLTTDDARKAALADWNSKLVRESLTASGDLNEFTAGKIKFARDFLGDAVGLISPKDVEIVNRVVSAVGDMVVAHPAKVAMVNGLTYAKVHLLDALPAPLVERVAQLSTLKAAERVVPKSVLRGTGLAIVGGLAVAEALGTVADAAEVGGTLLALSNGDIRFDPRPFAPNRFNGGLDYLANSVLNPAMETVVQGLPLDKSLINAQEHIIDRAQTEAWLRKTYQLPGDLLIIVKEDSSALGAHFLVDDLTTPGEENVTLIWRTPPGAPSGTPGPVSVVLRRAGPDGRDLIVQDLEKKTAQRYNDPTKELERAITNPDLRSSDPVKRAAAVEKVRALNRPSTIVGTESDGKLNLLDLWQTDEIFDEAGYRSQALEALLAQDLGKIVKFDENGRGVLSVVIDGALKVFKGTADELRQIVGALSDYVGGLDDALLAGPGRVLDDLKNYKSRGALLSYEDVGSILASQLMQTLPIQDPWARMGASTTISTVLTNIGQALDFTKVDHEGLAKALDKAFSDVGSEIAASGIGAVSSYLAGNLLASLGISGTALDASMAFAGPVIGKIAYNVVQNVAWDSGLTTGFYSTAAASFLGDKLADAIVGFDSFYGQLGSSLGQAVGSIAAAKLFSGSLATGNPYAIAAAAVVVALSKIVGGLLGSLFGPSTSSSSVLWSERDQRFVSTAATSERGGSKAAASSLTSAVSDVLNSVLGGTQARLIGTLPSQSLGMRNKDFIYWNAPGGYGVGNKSKDFNKIMTYAVKVNLDRAVSRLGGGDIYAKRALATDLALQTAANFNIQGLMGDLAIARDYGAYVNNRRSIDNLISNQTDSAFAGSWLVTLARAHELGLDRRGSTDWIGGWNLFLDENTDGAIDGVAWSPGAFELGLDPETGERLFTFLDQGGPAGVLGDTIDTESKDKIIGTDAADTILAEGNTIRSATASRRKGDGTLTSIAAPFKVVIAAAIDAGAGDDYVLAGDLGHDVFGGTGADKLIGGKLDDWLFGNDGNDLLTAGSVVGLTGFAMDAFLAGNAATVQIDAAAVTSADGGSGNLLDGGEGDDRLYGGRGSDWLKGSAGSDRLWGGDGGDILEGGAGDDAGANGAAAILGGGGSDQYVFGYGAGVDVIFDESDPAGMTGTSGDSIYHRISQLNSNALARNWAGGGTYEVDGSVRGGEDAISFGLDVTMNNLRIRRSGDAGTPGQDLIIELTREDATGAQKPTGDVLTIKDWFESTRRVEWLRFANGDEIRIGDVTSFVVGTAGQSVILGTTASDWLVGTDGGDLMYGLAGDDFGFGGLGDDLVAGDNDNDLVSGGAGQDRVIGGAGNDTAFGDGGADRVLGGAGADLLVGGRGDDEIVTGIGNDVVRYERGDGRDVLIDELVANWDIVYTGTTYTNGYILNASNGTVSKDGIVYFDGRQWLDGYLYNWDDASRTLSRHKGAVNGAIGQNGDTDTLEFDVGIDIQDIMLRRVGNDLELVILDENSTGGFAGASDAITIRDWWTSANVETRLIEKFTFVATGTTLLSGFALGTSASDSNDTLTGVAGADWITGGGGDDVITAVAGNDVLSGNQGNDRISGGAGTDVLYGGAGDDVLEGGAAADQIFGGESRDMASYAGSTATVRVHLDAAFANSGDAAGDLFDSIEDLEGGSGADRLGGNGEANLLRGRGGADTLWGGAGDDVYEFSRGDGNDTVRDGALVVEEILDASGKLNAAFTLAWELKRVGAATGVTGNYYQYQLTVRRTGDGEIVYRSRDGVDFLYSAQQATPPAGTAWPYANGQWLTGAQRANGVQTVLERIVAGDGGTDTLLLGAGISLADLTISRGTNLVKVTLDSSNSITLSDQGDSSRAVETLQLADGLIADLTRLRIGNEIAGAEGDFMIGGAAADSIAGLGGDDVLSGGLNADTLAGGQGNDVLEGGAGGDTLDGGSDAQSEGASVSIDSPASYGDTIRYVTSDAAVTIDLASGAAEGGHAAGDVVASAGGLSTIENIVGSEGFGDNLSGDDRANRLVGLGGADMLDGRGGDDVLVGGMGVDTLLGGTGADVLLGDGGDDRLEGGLGRDTLTGGGDNDTLNGDADDDRLSGEDGDDILSGGAGTDIVGGDAGVDRIDGGTGDDQLSGGDGNDQLTGGDGVDVLIGGAGDDLLFGGAGDDRYVLDADSGADRISDSEGANVLVLTGVDFSRVWLTRAGDDLLVSVIGGSTRATIAGFYSGLSALREIRLDTASLFPASAVDLVSAMTAASPAAPATIPTAIAEQLKAYWHAGGGAAPVVSDQALTMAEDGVLTGQVSASDQDSTSLGYAVSTAPGRGVVALDSATGAWTYTPAANANGEDRFILAVTDADGNTARQVVSVAITPINDLPSSITAPAAMSVREGTTAATALGLVTAVEPDGELIAPRFQLFDDAGGRFTITDRGQLATKAGAVFDYEKAKSFSIGVRVTDGTGAWADQRFTVSIENINERPTNITAIGLAVPENSAAGIAVATFTGVDPDASDTLTYALVDNAGGRFELVGRELRTTAAANLNFELQTSHSVQVRVTDKSGLNFTKSFTVNVNNVNEAPTALTTLDPLTIAENSAATTVVGSFSASDPDSGDTRTFSLTNNPGGRFAMSADGILTVAANASLDFDTTPTHDVTVRVVDKGGLDLSRTFTITLTNVNEAPLAPTVATAPGTFWTENVALAGKTAATYVLTDPDKTVPTLTITGDVLGWLEPNKDYVRFKTGIVANFEALANAGYALSDSDGDGAKEATYLVQVGTTDGSLASSTQTPLQIRIEDVNEAPTSVTLARTVTQIVERDRIGTETPPTAIQLGTLTAKDPDLPTSGAFVTFAYSVSDPRFEIRNTDQLWLKAGAMPTLDFEAAPTVTVSVTVRDLGGGTGSLSKSQSFTFNLQDRDDVVVGTASADTLIGQSGRDLLSGLQGNDTLDGLAGNDDLIGAVGLDTLDGGDGNDLLDGGDDNDTLRGGSGIDRLVGGAGNDLLIAGDGDDRVSVTTGDPWNNAANGYVRGGGGDDTIQDGQGRDSAWGEDGNDTYLVHQDGGAVNDFFDGGTGTNTISFATFTSGATASLSARLGTDPSQTVTYGDNYANVQNVVGSLYDDALTGDTGINTIWGGDGSDRLDGSAGDDVLDGGAGNDTLLGGAGSDTLQGGQGDDYLDAQSGNDKLIGGSGNDILIGGDDSDTYLLDINSAADEIRNFDPSGDDIDVIGYENIDRSRLWFQRIGNDLTISVVGSTVVTTIKDWYSVTTASERANYKVDFILSGQHVSKTINAEGLVTLMAGYTKPDTQSAFDNLHANLSFENRWKDYWDSNGAPVISSIADGQFAEGGSLAVSLVVTDDVTNAAGITVTAKAYEVGNPGVANTTLLANPTITAPDANGRRTLTLVGNPYASGQVAVRISAVDPGGLLTERVFLLTVAAKADAPTISQARATGTTLDGGSLGLDVQSALRDQDGSETLEIRISNVPTGLALNKGTNLGGGVWRLASTDLPGLALIGPATWSADLTGAAALTVTAISRESANGDTATSTATLAVPINARPTGLTADRALGIDETTAEVAVANGTTMAKFSRADPDNDAATFSLLDNASGRFSIDADGTLRVANNALLNREVSAGHSITVRVTDSGGLTYDQNFTVAVNDVNERPNLASLTSQTASIQSEGLTADIRIATYSASDPDFGQVPSVIESFDPYDWFYVSNNELRLRAGLNIDYEWLKAQGSDWWRQVTDADQDGRSEVSLLVGTMANDGQYNSADQTWVWYRFEDVNEAPSGPAFAPVAQVFAEGVSGDVVIATLGATDPEGSGITFGETFDAWDWLYVTGNQLHRRAGVSIDFEWLKSLGTDWWRQVTDVDGDGLQEIALAVDVAANDGSQSSGSTRLWYYIENVNEAPSSLWADRTLTFDENIGGNIGLAWLGAADPEGNVASYALLESAGGRFALRADGLLTTGAGVLDYENGGSASDILVRVTDSQGAYYDQWLRVSVNNLDEAPYAIWADRALSFSEGLGRDTGLAWLGAADPEGNIASYTLLDSAGGRFALRADGLLMTGAAALDFENGGGASNILVRVTDSGNHSYDQWFTVSVGNVNEAPYSIWADRSLNFGEGIGAWTGLAWFGGADPEGNIASYALVNDAGGRFAMRSDGLLMVGGRTLDFESEGGSSYVVVRATDAGGAYFDQGFWIGVGDGNEAPSIWNQTFSMSEAYGRSPPGTYLVGQVQATDPDVGAYANLRFALTGGDTSRFSIDATTGNIYLQGTVDFETQQSHTLQVTVTDAGGAGIPMVADVTIGITNVNEAPTISTQIVYADGSLAPSGTGKDVIFTGHDVDTPGPFTWRMVSLTSYANLVAPSAPYGAVYSFRGPVWRDAQYYPSYRPGLSTDYRVTWEVTDAAGASAQYTFAVKNPNVTQIAPIVLDLNGDGISLIAREGSMVLFDQDGDGLTDPTGWVARGDGLLVLDRNGNGRVDDGSEIRFSTEEEHAVSDLEGLRRYDTNANGFFDQGDAEFARFQVWRDDNQDGISTPEELAALATLDITAINLTLTTLGGENSVNENHLYGTTEYLRGDGSSGLVGDVMLAYQGAPIVVAIEEDGPTDLLAPIAIDLDGDGVELIERHDSSVRFDVEGSGTSVRTGWVAADDGFLALDRDGDGRIGNGREISFVEDLPGAQSDLEGLAAFDSNADGFFDANDARYSEFVIWQDGNQNGRSDEGELRTLNAVGIQAINLTRQLTGTATTPGMNIVVATSDYVMHDGRRGRVGDVMLAYDKESSPPSSPAFDFPDPAIDRSASHSAAAVTPSAGRPRRQIQDQAMAPEGVAEQSSGLRSAVRDTFEEALQRFPASPRLPSREKSWDRGETDTQVSEGGNEFLVEVDPSALHSGLALAQKTRFKMIEAMASFQVDEGFGLDRFRRGHAEALSLLTALPDVRQS